MLYILNLTTPCLKLTLILQKSSQHNLAELVNIRFFVAIGVQNMYGHGFPLLYSYDHAQVCKCMYNNSMHICRDACVCSICMCAVANPV